MRAALRRRVSVHPRHARLRHKTLERLFDPLGAAANSSKSRMMALWANVGRRPAIITVMTGNSLQS